MAPWAGGATRAQQPGFHRTLDYGMEGAHAVCKGSVRHLRGELEAVQKSVRSTSGAISATSDRTRAKVRELLLKAMNVGLKDATTVLVSQGGVLFRKHPYAAPPAGTGIPMITLTFMRLRALVEEGAAESFGEGKDFRGSLPTRRQARSGERGRGPQARGASVQPLRKVGPAAVGCPPHSRLACRTVLLPPGYVITRGAGSRVRGETVCLPTKSPCSSSRSRSKPSRCRHRPPRRRNKQSQQRGRREQEGEAEGSAHRASRAAVETSRKAAGAERDGALAATDSTGSAIRPGRPEGGQGRNKNG